MQIDERDPNLEIKIKTQVKGAAKELLLAYKLGELLRYKGLDGDDFRSTASWLNGALVLDTTELEDGKTFLSRETLSLTAEGDKLVSQKTENKSAKPSNCK